MNAFARLLGRTLLIVTTKVAVLAVIFYCNTVTAPMERGDFDECFNPHTAQVFVADDDRCSANPYK